MKKYIYQLAVRKADQEKKQYIIEHDIVISEKIFNDLDAQEMKNKYECDVQLVYLGELYESEQEIIIDAIYNDHDMIEKQINEWKEKEREAFIDANN